MNQQFYPNMQQAPYGGFYPQQQAFGMMQRPMAKYTQPLTEEEMKQLSQKASIELWQVTQQDQLKAKCTHKRNGSMTLTEEGDGVRCTICGAHFHMCDLDDATVKQITGSMLDMLQTIKAIYVDAPDSLISQYFQILPLLEKAPALWERALSNVKMYEGGVNNVTPITPGVSPFAMMNGMLSNPYAYSAPQPMYGGYAPDQTPYMAGPGYAQPMPQQMPMQNVPYQAPGMYPQQMGYDPNQYQQNQFAYGSPNMGQMQMAPGAGVPQPPMAPPANAPAQQAAPAGGEVTQTKTFTV